MTYRQAVEAAGIAAALDGLDWAIAGTPPLGLDLEGSDIDIVCAAFDGAAFVGRLWRAFGGFEGFSLRQWSGGSRAVIAGFRHAGWPFEIFGEPRRLDEQAGWRHFEVERRLLRLGGEQFRARVMAARESGLKTEPAFAAVLGLEGDAYRAMLDIADLDDAGLERLAEAALIS